MQSDLAPRLVRLFRDADLLTEADQSNYVKKHTKQKSILDVMRGEASVSSFRELLLTEIPLSTKPKSKANGTTDILAEQLSIVADLHEGELVEMLRVHTPPLEMLIRRLEESGAVGRGALQSAVEEAERRGDEPYVWLVQQGLLSSSVLQRFFNAPQNSITKYSSLFLALFILEHNRVISESAFEKLMEKIPAGSMSETLSHVNQALGVSSSALLDRIESGLNIPGISLKDSEFDRSLFELFPASLIRRKLFVPLYQDSRQIGVALSDPLNMNIAVLIRWITGKWMHPYFAPEGAIIDTINEYYESREEAGPQPVPVPIPARRKPAAGNGKKTSRLIVPPADPEPEPITLKITEPAPAPPPPPVPVEVPAEPRSSSRSTAKSKAAEAKAPARSSKVESKVAPVRLPKEMPIDSRSAVQLVTTMIENAIALETTDIHLEPTRDGMIVRYRLDGDLRRILSIPGEMVESVISRIKVLAGMDVTERRRPQDGHIMLEVVDRRFDLRVATIPSVFGEKTAIRVLDSSRVMTGVAQIGLSPKQQEMVERMIHQPYGMILVAGPTGSGKTSTLYACMSELNDERNHLITIEDPVEYQLSGINQIQVDAHTGVTFSAGLRAVLRQDPNVIMVGEIRDADTAATAIRAALTGHLVLSTLHTNTAIGAVQALGNLGASAYMIGSALTGVIAQRLVRRLCDECKESRPVTKALAQQLGVPHSAKLRFDFAKGCPACLDSGYKGRVGVFEVVEMTEALRQTVLNNESPEKIIDVANAEGRVSMLKAAMEKVKEGVTSPDEIIEKVMLDR
jgi:type II secretory ATPase GspE/PulE/Tfp pilus assembly ATPase PilB-like protein